MSLKLQEIKTNQLQKYRKQRSLRQRDIADLLGLQHNLHIYMWETGRRTPTLMNALKLSAVLQCPLEVLFFDHYKHIREEIQNKRKKLNINKENYV